MSRANKSNCSSASSTTSPTTVWLVQLQVRATSPNGSMNRNNEDTEQPRCTNRRELDCLDNILGVALYSIFYTRTQSWLWPGAAKISV